MDGHISIQPRKFTYHLVPRNASVSTVIAGEAARAEEELIPWTWRNLSISHISWSVCIVLYVYLIRGLEERPFGSIVEINKNWISRKVPKPIYAAKSEFEIWGLIYSHLQDLQSFKLNMFFHGARNHLGTDTQLDSSLCAEKEDRSNSSENICKGMGADTEYILSFPSPFSTYLMGTTTYFSFAEHHQINHQFHTVWWHVAFPSATTNKSTLSLALSIQLLKNVIFYCCGNVFLTPAKSPSPRCKWSIWFVARW